MDRNDGEKEAEMGAHGSRMIPPCVELMDSPNSAKVISAIIRYYRIIYDFPEREMTRKRENDDDIRIICYYPAWENAYG